ncbi:hypothetical protein NONO_c38170 [Nocardia nova SH22a]|uniref:Uncharacterized protein n=1 Tax=Nocardia nova SH22a TaxID=1415166 RepID=W5TMY3_9NOCA|nr:hypothetical protein NONO_c38170 [Nocardia nova SH22a]
MFSHARRPFDTDVQVRIWLGGMPFDFCATQAAARAFCSEWQLKRWEAVEMPTRPLCDVRLLPRLPCEQLFGDPTA